MFTGSLENDCTEEQIMSAKKTVQIITEVNGHQYVSEYEGTDVVALTCKPEGGGCRVEGQSFGDSRAVKHFINTLFKLLPVEDQLSLMLNLSLKLLEKSVGSSND